MDRLPIFGQIAEMDPKVVRRSVTFSIFAYYINKNGVSLQIIFDQMVQAARVYRLVRSARLISTQPYIARKSRNVQTRPSPTSPSHLSINATFLFVDSLSGRSATFLKRAVSRKKCIRRERTGRRRMVPMGRLRMKDMGIMEVMGKMGLIGLMGKPSPKIPNPISLLSP